MSKNILFNFIQRYPELLATQGYRIESKTSQKERVYFMFKIAPPEHLITKTIEKQYTWAEHHVSVYDQEMSDNFQLSQYHYSARFSDEQGNIYRLHVYFDDKDKLAGPPVFYKQLVDKSVPELLNDEIQQQFIQWAQNMVYPCIVPVRKMLAEKNQELLTVYQRAEEEASQLSVLAETSEKHLEKLIALKAQLEQIVPLSKSMIYQKQVNFINRWITLYKPPFVDKKEQEATEHVIEQDVKLEESTVKSSDFTFKSRGKREYIDAIIHGLVKQFSKLKQSNAPEIAELHSEINRVLLLIEEKAVLVGQPALMQLARLQREFRLEVEKAYIRALIACEEDKLNSWRDFRYVITAKHLNMALQTRNAKLLDLVLLHGDFAIDTQPVTVDKIEYRSAVIYCFRCHSNEKPLKDCLIALIKNNASLMATDDDVLPLGCRLLDHHHPLAPVLSDPRFLEQYKIFYKQLKAALEHYLVENPELLLAEREKIISQLTLINQSLALSAQLNRRYSGIDTASVAAEREFIAKTLSLKSHQQFREQLLQDPEYISLSLKAVDLMAQKSSHMTKGERKISLMGRNQEKDEVQHMLNKMIFDGVTTYEEYKKRALVEINLSIVIMENEILTKRMNTFTSSLEAKKSIHQRRLARAQIGTRQTVITDAVNAVDTLSNFLSLLKTIRSETAPEATQDHSLNLM